MSKEKNTPPKFYTDFLEKFPEIGAKYNEISKAVQQSGPLDEKSCALVKLAISGSAGMESAFNAHVRKANAAGVSREEIEQVATLMLPTRGFPVMMKLLALIEKQYEKMENQ